MCLPIDSWFCMSRTVNDDYHHPAPANMQQGSAPPPPAPPGSRTQQLPAHRNGGHYNGNGNGNGYPVHHAPAAAAAAAEADRKTSNDARRGPAYAVPAGAGAQEKADGTLKQQPAAARNGMVDAADGARGVAHNYCYYEREQPTHREDAAAADFYHHHPAATATADHERISAIHGC